MSQDEFMEVVKTSFQNMGKEIIAILLIAVFILIVYLAHNWIISLPIKLIKLIADYLVEWFGRLTSCTQREIKKKKRKISKTIDIVENTKDIADTIDSLKK